MSSTFPSAHFSSSGAPSGTSSSQFFANGTRESSSQSNLAQNPRRGSSFSIASMGGGGSSSGIGGGGSASRLERISGATGGSPHVTEDNERTANMFTKYFSNRSQKNTEQDREEAEKQKERRELRRQRLRGVLFSRAYNVALVCCSVLLLVGAQIRFLWLPKTADLAVDVVFCAMCLFFLVDIALRIDAEPNYFHFSLPVNKCFPLRRRQGASNSSVMGVGSFVFWCELVSTLALLRDISWVSPDNFETKNFTIFLNPQGIISGELTSLNQAVPFEGDFDLLLAIAKAARAARFIRSGEAVKLASAIQWFALWNVPKRWVQRIRRKRERRSSMTDYLAGPTDVDHNESGTEAAVGVTSDSQEIPDDSMRPTGQVNLMGQYASQTKTQGSTSATRTNEEQDGSKSSRRSELKVGNAMRELTGQRVAIGIIFSLLLTALFTYVEQNTIWPATMIVLHNQTSVERFREPALLAARSSVVSDLFWYQFSDGSSQSFTLPDNKDPSHLRDGEIVRISVQGVDGETVGQFRARDQRRSAAGVSLLSTLFIVMVWFFGVTAFAGPVMILVVIPIERMVRLLGMLMLDPLGYQGTSRYRRFVYEESEITRNTGWTRDVLKGMETSFLMSNILRIGSLMRVGFGSAGVEIIRNNLETGQNENMLILDSKGLPVSCIFLFCDIRQFTDATECLREEVFVFTNRIAAVVHSFCHSYGGSANKNVGDAFLLSWLLDEDDSEALGDDYDIHGRHKDEPFSAKNSQADKALWTVVKICISLHYDEFYLSNMSQNAREALLSSLSGRPGPVVQMGFGLHAGRAVQGAIGSQRKIDATYVSEAVELAEFLESSTKKYGLQMLMSSSFHRLLHPNSRRRCRKVDQLLKKNDDDEDEEYRDDDIMEIFTFDMDVAALFQGNNNQATAAVVSGRSDSGNETDAESTGESQRMSRKVSRRHSRRLSARAIDLAEDERTEVVEDGEGEIAPGELVLPTGPSVYNPNDWTSEDIRKIRAPYTDGLFFQTFNSGLQAFYKKDWETARANFSAILERFEDGPSKYFLDIIVKNDNVPPRDFRRYGIA